MLTYLIVLLDDTSTSYCHYDVPAKQRRLISLDDLNAVIVWAMKENLNVQFVYPDYELPIEYLQAIDGIDHTDIKPLRSGEKADVIVLDGWDDNVPVGATCIIKSGFKELAEHIDVVSDWLKRLVRLNVVVADVDTFRDADIDGYNNTLLSLADSIAILYASGITPQLNLLTDRLMLNKMNNCGSGDVSIAFAPNGKFYLCPAFYYDDNSQSIGNLKGGLAICNPQLLRLDHAPICRQCDAYQCRRCVWMNKNLTMDINTPSHQQCVIAHLERNASRELLMKLEKLGVHISNSQPIEEMKELDPFNIVNRWK